MTKHIDWEKIDNMLIAGCNGVQAAAAIGVHPETLYDRCKLEKKSDFSVYSQQKRAHGDGMLIAAQYHKAIKEKNPTMLIWLGKQRLGQKENSDNLEVKDLESKFDEAMSQVIGLLSSDRNMEESNISSDTKS